MPKLLRRGASNGFSLIDWNDALRHVTQIAKQMCRRLPVRLDLEDLVAEGLLGLVEAATRFDPQRNLKFRTYAEHRIRAAMMDSLRRLDMLSRAMRRKHRVASAALAEFTGQVRRRPTEEEIARQLKLTVGSWRILERQLYEAGSPVNGHSLAERSAVLVENLPSRCGDPEAGAYREELRRMLNEAVRTLPLQSQKVIALYYGREWTMRQISRELGVHESRVSQMHAAAIQWMRVHLEGIDAKIEKRLP